MSKYKHRTPLESRAAEDATKTLRDRLRRTEGLVSKYKARVAELEAGVRDALQLLCDVERDFEHEAIDGATDRLLKVVVPEDSEGK